MNCFSCSTSLVKGVHFCPNCGVATIHNTVVEGKSTANFDPLNRNFKPWRDLPLIPKRNYKLGDDKTNKSVAVKLPWCPPMRSLHPRKLKPKKSFLTTLPPISTAITDDTVTGDVIETTEDDTEPKANENDNIPVSKEDPSKRSMTSKFFN